MKKVIIVTDGLSLQRWCYTQVEAMLIHIENPVDVSSRQLRNLRKDNPGNTKKRWIVKHSGCTIECHPVMDKQDVKNDNPPCI